MKFKVIFYNAGAAASTDTAGNFTFYTLNSAITCAQAWAAYSSNFEAYVYDGIIWRLYT